jgi:hypothetical protein
MAKRPSERPAPALEEIVDEEPVVAEVVGPDHRVGATREDHNGNVDALPRMQLRRAKPRVTSISREAPREADSFVAPNSPASRWSNSLSTISAPLQSVGATNQRRAICVDRLNGGHTNGRCVVRRHSSPRRLPRPAVCVAAPHGLREARVDLDYRDRRVWDNVEFGVGDHAFAGAQVDA